MQSPPPQLKHKIIRAGAGSGKTSSLIDAFMKSVLSYYKQQKVFPRVVISTFTRKATGEIKERLFLKAIEKNNEQFIDYISCSPRLQISTIHGVLNHFLQIHGHYIGLSPGFTIMNEDSSHELFVDTLKKQLFEKQNHSTTLLDHYPFNDLIKIMKQYILHIQEYPTNSPFDIRSIKKAFEEEKTFLRNNLKIKNEESKQRQINKIIDNENTFLQSSDILNTAFIKCGTRVLKSLTRKKLELSCIDYNDLEFMSLEILKKQLSIETSWDFYFLDEYQDTSPIQQKILSYLTRSSSVFIVGDPQQSIYRFRGADVSVFKNKEKEIHQTQSGQIAKKRKNFRSSPELIAFFNDVFCNYRGTDSSHNSFERMETSSQQYNNKTEVAKIIFIEKSRDSSKETEQEAIFQRIKELLSNNVRPGDIAILSQKNKPLHELSRYLKNKNVPVYLHSTGQFHKNREIQDAVFLLRFFINPHHNENLINLLRTPYLRIPDQKLAEWAQQKTDDQSLWINSLKEADSYFVIKILNHHLEEAKNKGIVQAFQNALEAVGFFDLCYYQDPTGLSEANLWKLIYQLRNYPSSKNLLEFVDRLLQNKQLNEQDMESNNAVSAIDDTLSVNLMTIHTAKGLEFENVILMDINSNLNQSSTAEYFSRSTLTGQWILRVRSDQSDTRIESPLQKQITEKEKQERMKEMDRLFYVALTRAKKTITLISSLSSSRKPAKNSWMERFSFLSKLQDGQHSTNHYTYSVEYIPSRLTNIEILPVQSKAHIPPCQHPVKINDQETVKIFSVHDLLSSYKNTSHFSEPSYLSHYIASGLKGQIIHQTVESLKYINRQEPLSYNFTSDKETRKSLKFLESIKEIPIKKLLHTGFTEWPFRWRIKENCFFTGRIDLWGKEEGFLWVIDYKTNPLNSQKEQDLRQLSFYASVLNQIHPLLPIKRCLIYLSQKAYFVEDTSQEVISHCHKQITQFLSNEK